MDLGPAAVLRGGSTRVVVGIGEASSGRLCDATKADLRASTT
jgi:hypothetical protein